MKKNNNNKTKGKQTKSFKTNSNRIFKKNNSNNKSELSTVGCTISKPVVSQSM